LTDDELAELYSAYANAGLAESILRVAYETRDWVDLENGYIHIRDDLFIDLDSQLATGYEGIEPHNKMYDVDDRAIYVGEDGKIKNPTEFHGKATKDPEILQYVKDKLSPLYGAKNVWEYEYFNGGVKITGTSVSVSQSGSLMIPQTLDGRKVLGIGEDVFAGNTGLKKAYIIDDGLYFIGGGAFKNCAALENVVFISESGLKSIGNEVFSGCVNFKGFLHEDGTTHMPEAIVQIGDRAFFDCSGLVDTVITENGITENDVFRLPTALFLIGSGVFSGAIIPLTNTGI
jgi:hypothetical protein